MRVLRVFEFVLSVQRRALCKIQNKFGLAMLIMRSSLLH